MLTMTNSVSGQPLDLSSASTVVRLYFRAAGQEQVLSTIVCSKVGTGATGQVQFSFPGETLNVAPGAYEAEVEVDYDGQKQTVYETLKFSVRQQFA